MKKRQNPCGIQRVVEVNGMRPASRSTLFFYKRMQGFEEKFLDLYSKDGHM